MAIFLDRIVKTLKRDALIHAKKPDKVVPTVDIECHGEKFQDTNVWRSLILSKFPVSVNSHVIKQERRLPEVEGRRQSYSAMELLEEIADYVLLLETIELNTEAHQPKSNLESSHRRPNAQGNQSKPTNGFGKPRREGQQRRRCLCSSQDHWIKRCPKFQTPAQCRQEAQKLGCCFKCFDKGHRSTDCTMSNCPKCGGPHHSALCLGNEPKDTNPGANRTQERKPLSAPAVRPSKAPVPTITALAEEEEEYICFTCIVEQRQDDEQVVLMMAAAQVLHGTKHIPVDVTILFDSGASLSVIREDIADKCGLLTGTQVQTREVNGVGQVKHSFVSETVTVKFKGSETLEAQIGTIPRIMNPLRPGRITKKDYEFLTTGKLKYNSGVIPSLKRRDINQQRTNEIDILIGQDLMRWFVYEDEPRMYLPSGLLLTNTVFGHTISGRSKKPRQWVETSPRGSIVLGPQDDLDPVTRRVMEIADRPREIGAQLEVLVVAALDDDYEEFKADIRNLYSMESLGIRVEKDESEMKALDFMQKYRETIIMSPGRVEAGFPFLDAADQLKDNFNVAVKQLQNMLARLKPEHLELYDKTFQDYLRTKYIEEVSVENDGERVYHSPHHPVISPEKSTAFRVVFNASSHAKGELSLNDVIFPGYSLLALIYEVLLRFRTHDFVMLSDIQKAFLQIHLPESHRDVTRFLWRRDHSKPATGDNLIAYRWCRVPFGINATPAILNQVILKHLELVDTTTSRELAESIYVDNTLLHSTSEQELLDKSLEAIELFKGIGMKLRDFISNSPNVNESLPTELRAANSEVKMLGIPWSSEEDTLQFSLKEKPFKKLTMRAVLSQVNGACYDPLGIMSPFLLSSKVFLQSLHKIKKKWSDDLTTEEAAEFMEILESTLGASVSLPRKVTQSTRVASRSLMVFSDSSKKAYCAAAYVTTRTYLGETYTRLFSAKVKITPIKEVTIPRLELTGVLIAANLAATILKQSGLMFNDVHLFSDSTELNSKNTDPAPTSSTRATKRAKSASDSDDEITIKRAAKKSQVKTNTAAVEETTLPVMDDSFEQSVEFERDDEITTQQVAPEPTTAAQEQPDGTRKETKAFDEDMIFSINEEPPAPRQQLAPVLRSSSTATKTTAAAPKIPISPLPSTVSHMKPWEEPSSTEFLDMVKIKLDSRGEHAYTVVFSSTEQDELDQLATIYHSTNRILLVIPTSKLALPFLDLTKSHFGTAIVQKHRDDGTSGLAISYLVAKKEDSQTLLSTVLLNFSDTPYGSDASPLALKLINTLPRGSSVLFEPSPSVAVRESAIKKDVSLLF